MHEEIVQTIDRLHGQFEDLVVRGLRASGPEHLSTLEAMRVEFERIGAAHLAGRVGELVAAIRSDDRMAAKALLRAQTSLRLFERLLTLEVTQATLESLVAPDAAELDDDLDTEEDDA